MANYDYLFKYLLIGDSGVGKSSLLLRFADNIFSDAFIATVGVNFKIRTVNIDDKTASLQIESFQHIETWIDEIKKYGGGDSPMILVGNKSDMSTYRVVTYTMGKKYAEALGILFMETSAKSSVNVETLFMSLTSEVKSEVVQGKLDITSGGSVIVRNTSSVNKKRSWICC
ncbi:uncharacterized protein [Argopecten irradians]|uniref:uncharacterized protein isoform X2 n=1 Tax=Argopecten irradians TaxID=31199 RepID=UPI00371D19B1